MTTQETFYREIGDSIANAQNSQMFGKPCYKVNGKAFIAFFQNGMVFKLTGDLHKEAMNLDDAQLFDPSGKKRPMKEWVQLPFIHKEQWKKYALAAMDYVNQSK